MTHNHPDTSNGGSAQAVTLTARDYLPRIVTPFWACRPEHRLEVAMNNATFAARHCKAVFETMRR